MNLQVQILENNVFVVDSEWSDLNDALRRASFCLDFISDHVKIVKEGKTIIEEKE
jgi:hypothetical protein